MTEEHYEIRGAEGKMLNTLKKISKIKKGEINPQKNDINM